MARDGSKRPIGCGAGGEQEHSSEGVKTPGPKEWIRGQSGSIGRTIPCGLALRAVIFRTDNRPLVLVKLRRTLESQEDPRNR